MCVLSVSVCWLRTSTQHTSTTQSSGSTPHLQIQASPGQLKTVSPVSPPFSAGIKPRFPNFEGQHTDLIPGPTGSKLPRFCLWVKTTRSCDNPRHALETGRQDDGVRLDSWGHGFTAGSSFEELSLTGHRCSMP